MRIQPTIIAFLTFLAIGMLGKSVAIAQYPTQWIRPEQQSIDIDQRPDLSQIPIPQIGRPRTPTSPNGEWPGTWPDEKLPAYYLSLDEAIRIALINAEVIRVLGGVTAASSGRTIYDVAQTNTTIDQQQGRFDPTVTLNQSFFQNDSPNATLVPFTNLVNLSGSQTESYSLAFTLSQTNLLGGTASVSVDDRNTHNDFFPRVALDPREDSSLTMRYSQPLLQGGGRQFNESPILVARINTERSFFQYKDSVQELVRGVIDAYWSLVFARTDLWARENQVLQAEESLEITAGMVEVGMRNRSDQAQAEVAVYNFRATRLSSQSNVLQREEALRNLLGLPHYDGMRLVPSTPLREQRLDLDWDQMIYLAEQNRPDIIELKLILEADEQALLQARNQALPRLDAEALYRWNGLDGTTPAATRLQSATGQFADWQFGVNFSVPLGLRQARAGVRQQELVISRDRANLEQGVHAMIHTLAFNYRNADLLYAQYELFKQTRAASQDNLDYQRARELTGDQIFLNVLQAITDWGNSVSAEAQALTQYNTQLATLERQTGTILESHGIRFYEERYGFAGPLASTQMYPAIVRPSENASRYPVGEGASEESFDLTIPQLPNIEDLENVPQFPPGGPQLPQQIPPGGLNLNDPNDNNLGHRARPAPATPVNYLGSPQFQSARRNR